ncbi:MAG: hypothetical protein ACNI25_06540 [Halarcobacter sp.]
MKFYFQTIFYIFIALLFNACSSKYVTIKTLHPSLVQNVKMKNIFIEDFTNDYINQAYYIKESLVNHNIDNKTIFSIKNIHNNIDSIITGNVTTSLDIDVYIKQNHEDLICERYIYDRKEKTRRCISFAPRNIYCEKLNYQLTTNIEVLDKNQSTKFVKTYTKNAYDDNCYENRVFIYFNTNRPININRNEKRVYKKLAKNIANEFLTDVSAHYVLNRIPLIDTLDDSLLYTSEDKKIYQTLIENIEKADYKFSLETLKNLNKKYGYHSHEMLYTIAILYEKENLNLKAINYYKKALVQCKNSDNCKLINDAIIRVNKNMKLKSEAILELIDN